MEVWYQTEWSDQLIFLITSYHPRLEVNFECVAYILWYQETSENNQLQQ